MPKKESTAPEKSESSQHYDPAKIFLGSRDHGMTTERTQAFLDLLGKAKQKAQEN